MFKKKKKVKSIPLYCPNKKCPNYRKVIDYEIDISKGYVEWTYPGCMICLRYFVLPSGYLPDGYRKYIVDSDALI